jgi:2-polyprenyl-6-methoxyphenol hydroxylase-like FAD-dependent oxidoreductase
LPSPDKWREIIREKNDGSWPSEPYQRCSQAVFEAWLKPRIQAQPLIKSIFGWTFQGLVESDNGVVSTFVDMQGGKHIVSSKYVIGCDGAGSRVRRSIGVNLTGGPV